MITYKELFNKTQKNHLEDITDTLAEYFKIKYNNKFKLDIISTPNQDKKVIDRIFNKYLCDMNKKASAIGDWKIFLDIDGTDSLCLLSIVSSLFKLDKDILILYLHDIDDNYNIKWNYDNGILIDCETDDEKQLKMCNLVYEHIENNFLIKIDNLYNLLKGDFVR